MKNIYTILALLLSIHISAQDYTSYFTGNTTNITTSPEGGVCLMGGATEDDEAMKWFLNRSNGGDILVLRASGSDGYNDYFYSELGVSINSVETIVFNNANAASDTDIHQKIQAAEAIWFAGGDQWDYVSYWRNNEMENLINDAIENRNIVIGGTSAGMAILGDIYFSAENGTVTSANALNNPYNSDVTVDAEPFINTPFLVNTITDTHYDDPDRKGRHTVFLARIFNDYSIDAKGIACDEYTAVCIDTDGVAKVYGGYPTYDDFAYFLQINCEIDDPSPENCSPNIPLDWNKNGAALKVYQVPGTFTGEHTFDLNDWETGNGGTWYNWSVDNGSFNENTSQEPNCTTSNFDLIQDHSFQIYPNPSFDGNINIISDIHPMDKIIIYDVLGKEVYSKELNTAYQHSLDIPLEKGVYFTTLYSQDLILVEKISFLINE